MAAPARSPVAAAARLGARLTLVAAFLVGAATALAEPPPISATLEPRQITVGESAQLTITTAGMSSPTITIPNVPGLTFGVVGTSRRMQMMNGATMSSTSTMIRVTPQAPGVYNIPGVGPNSPPLLLQVLAPGASPDRSPSPNSYGTPPHKSIVAGGSNTNGLHLAADGAAFVKLTLPKREFFVGENIPVDIEVGMREGFVTALNGLPTLGGSDFTLDHLSHKPERSQRTLDGSAFEVFTWHSVIAAVKPGTYSLEAGAPVTVRIRSRPQKDSVIDDLLGDPFMQNFFGATVTKEITVNSTKSELTVLALPAAGRPADFSGAVGEFTIASDVSSRATVVGDPLTLRLRVTGEGNFDRVDTAMLDHLEEWKTYPPRANFKSSEPTGYRGEKTFEQPVIASQPGEHTLPPLSFTYFNPSTRAYETARTAPLTVTVSPSASDARLAQGSAGSPPAAPPGGTTPGTGSPGSNAQGNTGNPAATPGAPAAAAGTTAGAALAGLRPDHADDGSTVGSLEPPYVRPAFLAIPSVLALAFAGGWVGLRRRQHADTVGSAPGARKLSKADHATLERLAAAAAARDVAQFFHIARAALNADAGSTDAELRELIALADEVRYSPFDARSIDFAHWQQVVQRKLGRKETA